MEPSWSRALSGFNLMDDLMAKSVYLLFLNALSANHMHAK